MKPLAKPPWQRGGSVETMIYIEDGWVVIEHGDGRIEQVCREDEYQAGMVTERLGLPPRKP